MAAPPPTLNDDVTAEILLRLPPDEPEHLFRAALVCKPWLRIIRDPDFRRRYREFHAPPPLLGLLHRLKNFQVPPARLASTTSTREFPYPSSEGGRMLPVDCRHGRVLINMFRGELGYLVWDPLTGDRHYLPPEPDEIYWVSYSAAVLCAKDGCDHLDCHGGPFRVVFAAMGGTIRASVYSSETGAWSVPVSLDKRYHCPYILQEKRGAFVGDAVYFTVRWGNLIVRYDLGKDRLSTIEMPLRDVYSVALTAMENNTSLGFACTQGSVLYTWSRKVGTEEDAAEWILYKVIELERTIPVANPKEKPTVVGFAEGVDVIFISSSAGLFTVKLNSGQVKKVDEPNMYFSVLPYMSFYLPVMNETGNADEHDAADLLHGA